MRTYMYISSSLYYTLYDWIKLVGISISFHYRVRGTFVYVGNFLK